MPNGTPREIIAIPMCVGFTAVIAQVVLMRELVVVCSGNEISLGLMLASWLLWTAIGSGLLARVPLPLTLPSAVAMLQVAASIVFPFTIVLARSARRPFHVMPGELLSPAAMFVICFVVLAAFCMMSGWLFAVVSQLYAGEYGSSTASATGSVYLLEALGSCVGGLLASILLLRYCIPLQIAFIVVIVNVSCAIWMTVRDHIRRLIIEVAVFVPFIALMLSAPQLDLSSQARLWPGFHLASSIDSVYGHLDVVESLPARSMYENGLAAFHAVDLESAEDAVHFGLLQHPDPHTLLLIGGGLDGSLGQALQYATLTRLDYIELDPAIVSLAVRLFPEETAALRSRRVRVHNVDARLFLKTTAEMFDVIIVNLPDPQTAQLNRFYTREFFAEAASRLTPGGVLSLRVRGSEDYITPEQGEFLRCLLRTLRSVFPEVTAIPGDTIHFSATKVTGALTVNANELLSRLRARHIDTHYVSEYFLPFRLSPDRLQELERALRPRDNTAINTDLSPIAYYFALTLWSTRFAPSYRDLFSWLARVQFSHLLLVALLATCVAILLARLITGTNAKGDASLCVCTTGLALMGLEVSLLLGFQAIYGNVYYQLAIIIGAFMAGMAGGSWVVLQKGDDNVGSTICLPGLQIAAAISPLLLCAALRILTSASGHMVLLAASNVLFPTMALAFGSIGGAQFQVASRIFFHGARSRAANIGVLYAIDLLGAFVGAILVSAYLVPVYGMFKCACVISAVTLVPGLAALPVSRSAPRAG